MGPCPNICGSFVLKIQNETPAGPQKKHIQHVLIKLFAVSPAPLLLPCKNRTLFEPDTAQKITVSTTKNRKKIYSTGNACDKYLEVNCLEYWSEHGDPS